MVPSIAEPIRFLAGFQCSSSSKIMLIYIGSENNLIPFKKEVSDGVKMTEGVVNDSEKIQECSDRSNFTNLDSNCPEPLLY